MRNRLFLFAPCGLTSTVRQNPSADDIAGQDSAVALPFRKVLHLSRLRPRVHGARHPTGVVHIQLIVPVGAFDS